MTKGAEIFSAFSRIYLLINHLQQLQRGLICLKKSLPLSSTRMNAGKSSTSIFQSPAKYGFMLRSSDLYPAIPIAREVTVNSAVIDWPDFAKKHGLTFMQLREANHWIRRTTLNNKSGKSSKVLIPDSKALRYNPAETKAHNPAWVTE